MFISDLSFLLSRCRSLFHRRPYFWKGLSQSWENRQTFSWSACLLPWKKLSACFTWPITIDLSWMNLRPRHLFSLTFFFFLHGYASYLVLLIGVMRDDDSWRSWSLQRVQRSQCSCSATMSCCKRTSQARWCAQRSQKNCSIHTPCLALFDGRGVFCCFWFFKRPKLILVWSHEGISGSDCCYPFVPNLDSKKRLGCSGGQCFC